MFELGSGQKQKIRYLTSTPQSGSQIANQPMFRSCN
jgi:hypothetical protein